MRAGRQFFDFFFVSLTIMTLIATLGYLPSSIGHYRAGAEHFMSDNTIAITDATFDASVAKSSIPVLVDFWAPWCGPCLAIGPVLESLALEYKGKVTVAKMNVDENANVPATFGVRSIPYLVLFKDGKMVDSLVGAHPKARIVDLLKKAL